MSKFDDTLVLAGRIGLTALFLPSGIGKLVAMGATAGFIASKGLPMPQVLALGAGVLEVMCSLALIAGWKTKWAALALVGFTLLSAVLFHNFWASEAAQVMFQRISFFKNLGVAGGLLVLAAAGPGRYALEARRD